MNTKPRILTVALILACLSALPHTIQAQDAPPRYAVRVIDPAPAALGRESSDETVRRLMSARIDVVCEGRLDEAVAAIARALGVYVEIDAESAAESGIDMDTRVNWDFRGCTAWEAFNHLLGRVDLEGVVAGGRIVVLTTEDCEELIKGEMLDVEMLLQAAGAQEEREQFMEDLPEAIMTTVQPTTWDIVGGNGTLERSDRTRDGRFVMKAEPSVRNEVRALLAALEGATKAKTPVSVYPFLDENAAALAAIEKPVTLDLRDVPISDAAREIGRQIGMPINFDLQAFEEMGIGLDTPVKCRGRNLRAADALGRILRECELTWTVFGGGLMITTREQAECRLTTAVFDIHDLVLTTDGYCDLDSYIETITWTIEPCTWDSVGGAGSIGPLCLKDHTFLVVSQTQETLSKVKSLLDRIRRLTTNPCPVLRPRHEEWAALERVLAKPVTWHFTETPLEEAVGPISESLGVDVFLDQRALDDMGIATDTPISIVSGGCTAEDALRRMLGPAELRYVIAHGGLMITTEEGAEESLETVFDVSDLILFQTDSRHGAQLMKEWEAYAQFGGGVPNDYSGLMGDYDSLIECITTILDPTTWDAVGGPGSIAPIDGDKRAFLAMSQTQDVLDDVTRFLDALRENRKTKATLQYVESKTDAAVRPALEKRVAWSFTETPLPIAAAKIAADLGVDVTVGEMGIDPSKLRLSAPYTYLDARESLRRALAPLNLSLVIENGGLVIKKRTAGEEHLRTAIFNITDLLVAGKATEDGIEEAIHQTIGVETWDEVGGPAAMALLKLPGDQTVLVVSQEEQFLRQIGRQLDGLRGR